MFEKNLLGALPSRGGFGEGWGLGKWLVKWHVGMQEVLQEDSSSDDEEFDGSETLSRREDG